MIRALGGALIVLLAGFTLAEEPRFDRSLAIELVRGAQYVDERMQLEIARMLSDRLQDKACFREVTLHRPDEEGAAPPQELWLTVRLDSIEMRTVYGTSQAAQNDPNRAPDTSRNQTARVEVRYGAELKTAAGAVVRAKPFLRQTTQYRPRQFEDPKEAARANALAEIVQTLERFVCKGSAKKLERAIAEASASR